ncbi:MAG: hypothetical protein HOO06_00010 [Bdellovibrionaceae bacterium]|jgi:hypothetical protein|nr:hypothetical protein [Pseudobdellovibrionaceae bacterium]
MKKLILMAIVCGSLTATANSPYAIYTTYGVSVSPLGCDVPDVVTTANAIALNNANRICGLGFAVEAVGESETLRFHRGSCWAGLNSGAAVAINFKCIIRSENENNN